MTTSSTNYVIFKVGPVPCCVDSNSVLAVIEPPDHITAIPGSNAYRPGLFSYQKRAVAVYDMRTKFNLGTEQRGKIILTDIQQQLFGFWIDEIQQIIDSSRGRSQILPADCPKELFESLFLLNEQIIFKTNFEFLSRAQVSTRAQQFINKLVKQSKEKIQQQPRVSSANHSADTKLSSIDLSSHKAAMPGSQQVQPAESTWSTAFNTKNTDAKKTEYEKPVQASSQDKNKPEKKRFELNKPADRFSADKPFTTHTPTQSNVKPVASHQKLNRKPAPLNSPSIIDTEKQRVKKPATSFKQASGTTSVNRARQAASPSDAVKTSALSSVERQNDAQTNLQAYSQKNQIQHKQEKAKHNRASSGMLMLVIVLILLLPSGYFAWKLLQPVKKQNKPLTTAPVIKPEQTRPDDIVIAETTDNNKSAENGNNDLAAVPEKSDLLPAEMANDDVLMNTKSVSEQSETLTEENSFNSEKQNQAEILTSDDEITIMVSGPDARFNDSAIEETNRTDETSTMPDKAAEDTENKPAIENELTITAKKDTSITDNEKTIEQESQQNNEIVIQPAVTHSQARQLPDKPRMIEEKIIHVVVKGDTLWHIAKRYIHNPFKYHELARLSKIRNPDLIYPGNKVIIIIRHNK